MDLPSSNRKGRGGKGATAGGPRFHAVIIGEPIVAGVVDALGYPLSPVTPSAELPFALLPICNTPIIDYILENLVENGVHEVTVMLNGRSMGKVEAHLSQSRTARGKPWMSSDAITVNVLESHREVTKLADAVSEIRDRNVVAQSGSFLFVPIDCVAFFGNLQECLRIHLDRAQTIGKYAATLLCTPARERLDMTLHNTLVRQLAEAKGEDGAGGSGGDGVGSGGKNGGGAGGDGSNAGGGGSNGSAVGGNGSGNVHDDPGSPLSERGPLGLLDSTGADLTDYSKGRFYIVPAQPSEHHTMFVLDRNTGVVSHMVRQEVGDDAPEPPTIVFNRKKQYAVRMDLVPTGFLFVCCEALPLIEFHIRDIWEFLNTSLLGQVELYGNVFGVLEVPRRQAIVNPVCGLGSYLQANIDVCARRLFPLTRESSFAEALAKYAVSRSCETVYAHTSARVLGAQHAVGPNVVIGENVLVPASADLAGVVMGANVQLGEKVTMTSCVVMDGAALGRGCTVRHSIIGPNAVIGDHADVSHCIIGAGCVVGGAATTVTATNTVTSSSSGNASQSLSLSATPNPAATGAAVPGSNAAGIVIHKQAIVYEPAGESCGSPKAAAKPSNSGSSDDEDEDSDEKDSSSDSDSSSSRAHGAGRKEASQTDHWLVGPDGLGRGLLERYEENIMPTTSLFTEDPVPGKAAASDDDDSGSSDEDDEAEVAFKRSIRRHVEAALLQPARIEASCYDMTTTCLSFQLGYPELCEAVTEMLVEHILEQHSTAGANACLNAAVTLFGQWCRSFYDGFLSKNGNMLIEAMVATLEGMSAAIRDPSCVLYLRAAELMEVLYCGCDDDMYDARGYCIVSAQGMIAFDTAMTRRRVNLEKYSGFPGVKAVQQRPGAAASSSSEEDSSSDDDDSELSRDSLEEGKVVIANICHPYIVGVKEYLEENGEL